MTLNMFDRDDLGPLRRERRYSDVDVLNLVSRLGEAATEEFLDGLKPHLAAVQRQEKRAARELGGYLHASAVSAVALLQLGGLDGLREAEERAAKAPVRSVEDVLSAIEQQTSK